jgi:hypothetical protein
MDYNARLSMQMNYFSQEYKAAIFEFTNSTCNSRPRTFTSSINIVTNIVLPSCSFTLIGKLSFLTGNAGSEKKNYGCHHGVHD